MLNIGGELASILQDVDYSSKQELLEKLRKMRKELKGYPKEARNSIRPILAVAIQEAFYADELELLSYKEFIIRGNVNGGKNY